MPGGARKPADPFSVMLVLTALGAIHLEAVEATPRHRHSSSKSSLQIICGTQVGLGAVVADGGVTALPLSLPPSSGGVAIGSSATDGVGSGYGAWASAAPVVVAEGVMSGGPGGCGSDCVCAWIRACGWMCVSG